MVRRDNTEISSSEYLSGSKSAHRRTPPWTNFGPAIPSEIQRERSGNQLFSIVSIAVAKSI